MNGCRPQGYRNRLIVRQARYPAAPPRTLQRATVRQMKYGKPAEGILSNLDAYTSKAA